VRGRGCVIALAVTGVIVLALGIGGYAFYLHVRPYLLGTNCATGPGQYAMTLDLDQASDAATISAVALRRGLPDRAVVIAYATALQESKLYNLPGGDLDSIGIFQQRPSEGWGPAAKLADPAYASGRFFDALVKIPHYLRLPVAIAAQDVQRSADGSAYAEHVGDAETLAAAFTGQTPGALRCWYPPNKVKPTSAVGTAITALHSVVGRRAHPDGDSITVPNVAAGWTVASWMVANAQSYGLRQVSFDGEQWRSSNGHDGWTSITANGLHVELE
jgi:hypothetical protein